MIPSLIIGGGFVAVVLIVLQDALIPAPLADDFPVPRVVVRTGAVVVLTILALLLWFVLVFLRENPLWLYG